MSETIAEIVPITETTITFEMDSNHSNFFIDTMVDHYGYTSDVLTDILQNRSMYEGDPGIYSTEITLLKIFDKYLDYRNVNKCVANSMLATCYWYIYQNFNHEIPEFTLEDEKGRVSIRYNLLTDWVINKYMIIYWKKMRFIFDGELFTYDDARVQKEIENILRSIGYSDKKKIDPIIREIVLRIACRCVYICEDSPFDIHDGKLIPCKNGTILRKNMDILPNSPAWGFMYQIPVLYDPSASTQPINKFLKDVASKDVQLLVQIPAQALIQNANYQLAYLLTGDGSNGKSTYLQLIGALIGSKNASSLSLQEIITDKFKGAELYGKRFNYYADLSKDSLKDTGRFKVLTGGDTITAERKYGDPFQFVNKAVFTFSANELPVITDGTFAFWRRWAIIEFKREFPVNPGFIDELITKENLSGFLNLILVEMNRIDRDGVIRGTQAEEVMELWRKRSNSAYAFIKERLKRSVSGSVKKSDLWNQYNKFCIENDFTEVGKAKFRQQLEKEYAIIETYTVKERERVVIIKGIEFVDGDASKENEAETTNSELDIFKEKIS
jgi:putative DNA primase/helicase